MVKSTLKVFVNQITVINKGKGDRNNEMKTLDQMKTKSQRVLQQ